MSQSHVSQFFSSYPDFQLNQDATPTKQFMKLKKVKRWNDGDTAYIEASENFANALAADFDAKYGTDVDNIENWHVLCRILRIDPVPEDISACRKAVKSKHVNLVDLVYHSDEVQTHHSVTALAKYSLKHKKIFPKEPAKAGGVLRYLLRPILKVMVTHGLIDD